MDAARAARELGRVNGRRAARGGSAQAKRAIAYARDGSAIFRGDDEHLAPVPRHERLDLVERDGRATSRRSPASPSSGSTGARPSPRSVSSGPISSMTTMGPRAAPRGSVVRARDVRQDPPQTINGARDPVA